MPTVPAGAILKRILQKKNISQKEIAKKSANLIYDVILAFHTSKPYFHTTVVNFLARIIPFI